MRVIGPVQNAVPAPQTAHFGLGVSSAGPRLGASTNVQPKHRAPVPLGPVVESEAARLWWVLELDDANLFVSCCTWASNARVGGAEEQTG